MLFGLYVRKRKKEGQVAWKGAAARTAQKERDNNGFTREVENENKKT